MNILAQTRPAETVNEFWIQLLIGIICVVVGILLTLLIQRFRKQPKLQLQGGAKLISPLEATYPANPGGISQRTIIISERCVCLLNIGDSVANVKDVHVDKVLRKNKSMRFEQKEAHLRICAPGGGWNESPNQGLPPMCIPAGHSCYIRKNIFLKDEQFTGGPWEVRFTVLLMEKTLFRTRRKFSFNIARDRA